jgi:pimeloyl-ACP methyl ester carboxylesterase
MDVIHDYIVANGVRLHCATMGDGSKTVILLHGFPEFWYSWRHQMQPLADAGFKVVAPDLRGYNLSDRPTERHSYHLTKLVDDIASFVRITSGSPAHIVGHDWGGIIAWSFAGRYPQLMDKLVILNAPHMGIYFKKARVPPQLFRSWYVAFFCVPGVSEAALSANDYGAVREMFQKYPANKNAFSKVDIDEYISAIAQPGALTAALNYYRSGMLAPDGLALAKHATTKAPTLVIWGEKDPALVVGLLDGLDRYAPNLIIHRIPQASHWVQSEAPEEVNAALLKFLAGN